MSAIESKSGLGSRVSGLGEKQAPAFNALAELCGVFPAFEPEPAGITEVASYEMPESYRQLLVHSRHMTAVLGAHHDAPLDLYVLRTHQAGDYYSRQIFLTRQYSAVATELGVVRINLRCLHEKTRQEILDARRPLGAVLMRHEWSRKIEPRWYLRFDRGCSVLRWFGYRETGPFFGRIGTIYCGGEPAVEMLEIVTLWD